MQDTWYKLKDLVHKFNELNIISFANIDQDFDGQYSITIKPYYDIKLKVFSQSSADIENIYAELQEYYKKTVRKERWVKFRDSVTWGLKTVADVWSLLTLFCFAILCAVAFSILSSAGLLPQLLNLLGK